MRTRFPSSHGQLSDGPRASVVTQLDGDVVVAYFVEAALIHRLPFAPLRDLTVSRNRAAAFVGRFWADVRFADSFIKRLALHVDTMNVSVLDASPATFRLLIAEAGLPRTQVIFIRLRSYIFGSAVAGSRTSRDDG